MNPRGRTKLTGEGIIGNVLNQGPWQMKKNVGKEDGDVESGGGPRRGAMPALGTGMETN